MPLTAELPGERLLDAALILGKQVNAHIHALFILPNPDAALGYIPDVILAAGVMREIIERETQEAAEEAKKRFVDWRTRNDLPGTPGGRLDTCFATWAEQTGEIEEVVTTRGRLSDLVVAPRSAPRGRPSATLLRRCGLWQRTPNAGRRREAPSRYNRPCHDRLERQPRGKPGSARRYATPTSGSSGVDLRRAPI